MEEQYGVIIVEILIVIIVWGIAVVIIAEILMVIIVGRTIEVFGVGYVIIIVLGRVVLIIVDTDKKISLGREVNIVIWVNVIIEIGLFLKQ